jgi:hypothetical protein
MRMSVLANVVTASDVFYTALANVTNSCIAVVSGALDVAVLERKSFTAQFSLSCHISLEALWAAVVVTISVCILTSVSTIGYIEISSANIATGYWMSEIISSPSRNRSQLKSFTLIAGYPSNNNPIVNVASEAGLAAIIVTFLITRIVSLIDVPDSGCANIAIDHLTNKRLSMSLSLFWDCIEVQGMPVGACFALIIPRLVKYLLKNMRSVGLLGLL